MDNKVPKGKGLGQSTISQIRPEFIVARNEGMELDQPRNSGDLEKFVQFSEQEPVPFGIRPVGLFLVTFKSLKTARIAKLKIAQRSLGGPLISPSSPRWRIKLGGVMTEEKSAVGHGLEDKKIMTLKVMTRPGDGWR